MTVVVLVSVSIFWITLLFFPEIYYSRLGRVPQKVPKEEPFGIAEAGRFIGSSGSPFCRPNSSPEQWRNKLAMNSLPLSLSVLMAIFPGEPGLAGFTGAKDDANGGGNRSYRTCKAPVKLSPPTNQRQTVTTNKPTPNFLEAFLSPNQQCRSTEGTNLLEAVKKNKTTTTNCLLFYWFTFSEPIQVRLRSPNVSQRIFRDCSGKTFVAGWTSFLAPNQQHQSHECTTSCLLLRKFKSRF